MTAAKGSPDARNTVADGVRRCCATIDSAVRSLQTWTADPLYRDKHLSVQARADLADARDRITALLGDHHG